MFLDVVEHPKRTTPSPFGIGTIDGALHVSGIIGPVMDFFLELQIKNFKRI